MNQWEKVVWAHRRVTLQSYGVGIIGQRKMDSSELWVHKTYLYQLLSKGEK